MDWYQFYRNQHGITEQDEDSIEYKFMKELRQFLNKGKYICYKHEIRPMTKYSKIVTKAHFKNVMMFYHDLQKILSLHRSNKISELRLMVGDNFHTCQFNIEK